MRFQTCGIPSAIWQSRVVPSHRIGQQGAKLPSKMNLQPLCPIIGVRTSVAFPSQIGLKRRLPFPKVMNHPNQPCGLLRAKCPRESPAKFGHLLGMSLPGLPCFDPHIRERMCE